eukprot:gnl/MRDRNA2_/MRDRNA2_81785_c0_seq1.p1 gnl/MRDRNA2_/MRDRNA2_81785_c0~~gnl/MRDRNA2_/MRDRNA2_81785_c0_seq1.p1  ORF type:complete len:313 (+),score=42.26 gnl/MRDRNA2_/MRDRNA2_81785_c0_seq1:509-1447(+)
MRPRSSMKARRFTYIHIPRQTLRAKIVEQISPGTIRWSSKLKDFSEWTGERGNACDGKGVTISLTDGTTIDAALLIAADGIFSTVRRQLSLRGDCLNYLGLIVVLGIVTTTGDDKGHNGKEEAVAIPLTQHRIFETVDGTTRIYAMPFTKDATMWQLSFPFAEAAARALVKDPAALKAEVLQRCGQWHDPVPSLLRSTPLDCMSGYPIYDRDPLDPEVLRMPHMAEADTANARPAPQCRVTMIGDAAHPMSPFKGQGANQALFDAVLLAEILEDSVRRHGPGIGLDIALPLFEKRMLNRTARVVRACIISIT